MPKNAKSKKPGKSSSKADKAIGNPPKGSGPGPSSGVKVTGGSGETQNSKTKGAGHVSSAELFRVWRKEGRCFTCGSEAHQRKACPLSAAKKAAPESNSNPRPGKRNRASSPSGLTPPAKNKRQSKTADAGGNSGGSKAKVTPNVKRVSYANVASNDHVVAVNKNGTHIKESAFDDISREYDKVSLARLRGEHPHPLSVLKSASYSSTMATWGVVDDESKGVLCGIIEKLGLRSATMEELKQLRRPTTQLSGFAKGPIKELERGDLELLLGYAVKSKGIPGKVTLAVTKPTPKGLLMFIRVDDEAKEGLAQVGNILNLSSAGDVLFQDLRSKDTKMINKNAAKMSSEAVKDRLDKLYASIEEQRKEAAELEKINTITTGAEEMSVDDPVGAGPSAQGENQ